MHTEKQREWKNILKCYIFILKLKWILTESKQTRYFVRLSSVFWSNLRTNKNFSILEHLFWVFRYFPLKIRISPNLLLLFKTRGYNGDQVCDCIKILSEIPELWAFILKPLFYIEETETKLKNFMFAFVVCSYSLI